MHESYEVTCPARPTRAQERMARRRAAGKLGVMSLRGLTQAPERSGVRYYSPGSDDEDGQSVLIVYR